MYLEHSSLNDLAAYCGSQEQSKEQWPGKDGTRVEGMDDRAPIMSWVEVWWVWWVEVMGELRCTRVEGIRLRARQQVALIWGSEELLRFHFDVRWFIRISISSPSKRFNVNMYITQFPKCSHLKLWEGGDTGASRVSGTYRSRMHLWCTQVKEGGTGWFK